MYGIFVNEDERPFATWIVDGSKTIETRTRDMLGRLLFLRVAIIRTKRGARPTVVGYATIQAKRHLLDNDRDHWLWYNTFRVLARIDYESKYAFLGKGKWLYYMTNAEACEPYELPSNAIRHGRAYAEF